MATTKLTLDKLDELSLVDRPANQHAKSVAIFKRDAGRDTPSIRKRLGAIIGALFTSATAHVKKDDAETFNEALAVNDMWELMSALSRSVSSIIEDDTLTPAQQTTALDQTWAQFRDKLATLATNDDAFTKAATSTPAASDACKACGHAVCKGTCADCAQCQADKDTPAKKNDNPGPGGTGATLTDKGIQAMATKTLELKKFDKIDDANAHIAALTEQANVALKAAEDAKTATGASGTDDVTKGMTPEAAQIFKAQAQRIEKMEQERAEEKRVLKATQIAKGLKLDITKLANVLKFVESDKDALEFIEGVIKQNGELRKELDGYEIGDTVSDGTADAQARLTKRVDELRKADPKLSHSQAVSKALDEDPELYEELEDGGSEDDK